MCGRLKALSDKRPIRRYDKSNPLQTMARPALNSNKRRHVERSKFPIH